MDDSNDRLERLYDAHAAALFGFILSLTRSDAEASDILQELFVRLARKPRHLASMENPRAWLMQAAYRLVIDASRRRNTREKHARSCDQTPIFAPADDPDEAVFRAALADSLEALPPEQRAAVHLKLWQGLTFEEIASVMGIPANTAASRYRYGLDKLRGLLRPIYEEIK